MPRERGALLAQRLVNDIALARLCLLNPTKKAAYDSALEASQRSVMKPNPIAPVDKSGPSPERSNGAPGGNRGKLGVFVGAALVVAGVVGGIVLIGRIRPVEHPTDTTRIANRPLAQRALEIPLAKEQVAEPKRTNVIDSEANKPSPATLKEASPSTSSDSVAEKPDRPAAHRIGADLPEYHRSALGEQVERAIREGVRYLKQVQREDGTWADDPGNDALTGATSLAALALLASGEKPNARALQKSLSFLRGYGPEELRGTYAVSLQTMVFAAAEPDNDRARIAANVGWLERAQIKKGDRILWPGSWTYSQVKRHSFRRQLMHVFRTSGTECRRSCRRSGEVRGMVQGERLLEEHSRTEWILDLQPRIKSEQS